MSEHEPTREEDQLAIQHRTVIGQAEGILIERFKIKADDAFTMLRMTSNRSQRKLYDLAAELVETGVWPPP